MSPELKTTLERISIRLKPYATELSNLPSFVGVAIFVKDQWHTDNASLVAYAPRNKRRRHKLLSFTKKSIIGKRVDLAASTLGEIFKTRQSTLQPSRMYKHHNVWGAYAAVGLDLEFVIQLAFDTRFFKNNPPTDALLADTWAKYQESMVNALYELDQYSVKSFGDTLALDVPVTPNTYVIKWDIVNSTEHAAKDYGEFRKFLVTYEGVANVLAAYTDGSSTSYMGDGQNIVLTLPPNIDPNDPKQVGAYGRKHVVPLISKLVNAHKSMNTPYRLRFAVGLGYIETSQHNEQTGPVLWKLHRLLKSMNKPRYSVVAYEPSTAKLLKK